jgi:WD40 repeat protein
MRFSLGVASLLTALALTTLAPTTLGGTTAPSDEPPGAAGARPPESALVDLTEDSMIFGPDEKQKNLRGEYVNGMIVSAAFSPDGKSLVTGDGFGMVKVFEPGSGRHRISFRASDPNEGLCDSIAFSPDGRTIAVRAGKRGHAAMVDFATGRILREMQTFRENSYPSSPNGLAFSPDGGLLAGGMDWSGETWLWEASSGRLLRAIPPQMIPGNRERGGQDTPAPVRGVSFSPDSSTLYISGYRLLMWDVRGDRPRPSEWPGDAYAGDLKISRDGTRLAVIGAFQGRTRGFHELAVVEAATGRVLCNVEEDGFEIVDAAFTPDGRTIATLVWYIEGKTPENQRYILRLREASTLRPVATAWFGRGLSIKSVAISPDGRTIAAGGCSRTHTIIGIAEWDGTQIRPWRKDP